MALTLGIVGLPNVGKSTLFNALTKNDVLAANYPFATIEPNTGVVGVPDGRLAQLARIFDSAEIIPATVTFVDIAGIVKGASEGAGLGNKFLANIRESNAICQVLRVSRRRRCARGGSSLAGRRHRDDQHRADLADLQTLENAIPRLTKEARNDKTKAPVLAAAEQAVEILNKGTTLFSAGFDAEPVRELSLLTAKPYVYVINCDEQQLTDDEFKSRMRELVAPAEAVFLDAKVEAELVELPADEALELLQSVGQEESGLDALARVGFATLGLQTYLTAGPKEARAWTIPPGTPRLPKPPASSTRTFRKVSSRPRWSPTTNCWMRDPWQRPRREARSGWRARIT